MIIDITLPAIATEDHYYNYAHQDKFTLYELRFQSTDKVPNVTLHFDTFPRHLCYIDVKDASFYNIKDRLNIPRGGYFSPGEERELFFTTDHGELKNGEFQLKTKPSTDQTIILSNYWYKVSLPSDTNLGAITNQMKNIMGQEDFLAFKHPQVYNDYMIYKTLEPLNNSGAVLRLTQAEKRSRSNIDTFMDSLGCIGKRSMDVGRKIFLNVQKTRKKYVSSKHMFVPFSTILPNLLFFRSLGAVEKNRGVSIICEVQSTPVDDVASIIFSFMQDTNYRYMFSTIMDNHFDSMLGATS